MNGFVIQLIARVTLLAVTFSTLGMGNHTHECSRKKNVTTRHSLASHAYGNADYKCCCEKANKSMASKNCCTDKSTFIRLDYKAVVSSSGLWHLQPLVVNYYQFATYNFDLYANAVFRLAHSTTASINASPNPQAYLCVWLT